MSGHFSETNNFKEFFDLYTGRPNRVVFFVGAGLSMPLFPSWRNFLKSLVAAAQEDGKLDVESSELVTKVDEGRDYLEVASYCADALGRNEYRNIIEKNFEKDFALTDVPAAYRDLLDMPFKAILTTNYDRIPEVGGKGVFNCYNNKNISEAMRALEKEKRIVIKIHGDVLDQDSIVLTREDYNRLMYQDNDVQTAMKSVFSTSTICFLGCSFTDPHFSLILDYLNQVNNGKNILHYAFLGEKSDFEIKAAEKRYGLKAIRYNPADDSHPEVSEFIGLLRGNRKAPRVDSNSIIDSASILTTIEARLQTELAITSFYINYEDATKRLVINYFTRGSSPYEQQRELISIYRVFDFETDVLNTIKVCSYVQTPATVQHGRFSPVFLVSESTFEDARRIARRLLSELDFWKTLKFAQPFMVGNLHFVERQVKFDYINF